MLYYYLFTINDDIVCLIIWFWNYARKKTRLNADLIMNCCSRPHATISNRRLLLKLEALLTEQSVLLRCRSVCYQKKQQKYYLWRQIVADFTRFLHIYENCRKHFKSSVHKIINKYSFSFSRYSKKLASYMIADWRYYYIRSRLLFDKLENQNWLIVLDDVCSSIFVYCLFYFWCLF